MDINQLRQFIEVCDKHSYSKAASRLYVSRQALRKSIAMVEDEIGAPLFLYQNNRLYLTVEGERLKRDAENVLSAFDTLVNNNITDKSRNHPSFKLLIDETMFPFMVTLFLPQINEFFYDHPEIDYSTGESTEDDIISLLENGMCDGGALVLPNFEYAFLENYYVINLVPGKPAVAVNRQNTEVHFAQYPYSAIAGKALFFPGTGKTMLQQELLKLLHAKNADPCEIRLASSVEECAAEVIKGNGVSFCTYPGCKKLIPSPSTTHIPMEDSEVGFNLVLLLRKNTQNPCVELLMKYLGKNPV